MELGKFFNYLYKYITIIIIIPVVTVAITYFLVRNLPSSYLSKAQISTGIVDKSEDAVVTGQPAPAQQEVEQKFSNMIQILQMQKVLDLVSYKLILHDLDSPTPFRKHSKVIQNLSPAEKKRVRAAIQYRYERKQPLTLMSQEEEQLNAVISSMHYNADAIREKLRVFRVGQSDFITVEFESEDAKLTAFIANSVCEEFIDYYAGTIKDADRKSVNFLSNLLMEKQRNLNEKMNLLKSYKIKNGVLNLPEQARILYGRMIEVQSNREKAEKDITSFAGAIKDISNKFTPKERRYLEATSSKVNADIVAYRERLQAMNLQYIQDGFDATYKESMDSLQNALTEKIIESVDENIFNPLAAKQDLVSQKINLEMQLDIIKHSVSSLLKEYNSLSSQFSRLVPFEASIQSYERDIEIASQEYLDILDKYNLSSMQSNFSIRLKQSQVAMPGAAQPSKKMLLIILSGIIGFTFVVLVLFIMFYLDTSITHPKELANATKFPVLGHIEKLSSPTNDVHTLWNWHKSNSFKDQLRSIRFEISNELQQENFLALPSAELSLTSQNVPPTPPENNRILCVTSFSKGEGKTLLSISLAYAFALTNKNVLLIDGNFTNPSLSKSINAEFDLEDYLQGKILETDFKRRGISVLGNKGNDISLLEVTDQKILEEKLGRLKASFDYIIVETPSLKALDKAKEWFQITDKIVGVFEANLKVNDQQKNHIDYLHALNSDKFIGWVINKVQVTKAHKKTGWFKKNVDDSVS